LLSLGLKNPLCRLLLATFVLAAPPALTQQQQSAEIPLEALLMRLQIRIWAYDRNVPDFFADERVISSRTVTHAGTTHNTTDSIFRLRRTTDPGVTPPYFIESREVKAVDGRPTRGEAVIGPAIFSGAFSNALLTVSMEGRSCFDYRVEPHGHLHHVPAIVVVYTPKPSAEDCPGSEPQSGRAWIDPQNFQLQRIEMRIPNHHLDDGSRALWTWSVDYSPVPLEGKIFWLPKTIISNADANDGSAQWTFTAYYRNYHKTNVTSHIITNLDNNSPNQTQPSR